MANAIARIALALALAYGAGVTGRTGKQLSFIDKLVHGALGLGSAASRVARLTLTGGLPSTKAAVAAACSWSRGWFDEMAPADVLAKAWRAGMAQAARSIGADRQALGAAEAAIYSFSRAGWKLASPSVVIGPDGCRHDLRKVAPITLAEQLEEDYERQVARQSGLARRLGGEPDLEPLKAHLRTKACAEPEKQSLISLAEGRWRTQSMLWEEGLVDTPLCASCGEARGTILHRCGGCSAKQQKP